MKRLAILFVALLAVPAIACAQQVVREMRVTLQLDVGANGQVTAVKTMAPPQVQVGVDRPVLPDVLAKAAERVASKWRFKARRIEGVPVSGRTWAFATLQIVKHEQQQVDSLSKAAVQRGRGKQALDLGIGFGWPLALDSPFAKLPSS